MFLELIDFRTPNKSVEGTQRPFYICNLYAKSCIIKLTVLEYSIAIFHEVNH